MTSERGIPTVLAASARALKEMGDLSLILVGDPALLEPAMAAQPGLERARLEPALQTIGMDEEPGAAFKAKRDASVVVTARMVKEGKAQAAVSPGNTGASVVSATLTLGRLTGIRRPGIISQLPQRGGGTTAVMDVGAVVDCRPDDLCLFGIMGNLYAQQVMHKPNPRVGLLSIGEEDIKGNDQTLSAFSMLKKAPIQFIGNVEGYDIFNGRVDVVVCDGFVGNVLLKTAEGVVRLIGGELKSIYAESGPFTKMGGFLSKPAFRELALRASADEHGGSSLLGVAGNFIIAHGSANQVALKNAIRLGYRCAADRLVEQMAERIAQQNAEAKA
jgi:glycerol-3-phosphate acyltransferase PlsX